MSDPKKDLSELGGVPEAEVRSRKRHFSISIVWLVPLVAVLIGGWLVFKALSEKGPTIAITFKSAEGLEAGKTKIKYKDVELGQVSTITLSPDLSQVIVTAELVKEAEKFGIIVGIEPVADKNTINTPQKMKKLLDIIDSNNLQIVFDPVNIIPKKEYKKQDEIILELKSVRRVIKAHEIQLVNYLTATGNDVGLIINFGESKVEIKRKVRELAES